MCIAERRGTLSRVPRHKVSELVREAYALGYSDGFAKYGYREPAFTELFQLKVV